MMNQTSGARLSPIVILQIHESLSSVFVFIFSGCDSNQYLPRKEQRERERKEKKSWEKSDQLPNGNCLLLCCV